jgi:hypothetical protein
MMKTRHSQFARLFAAGLMVAALVVPVAASAGVDTFLNSGVKVGGGVLALPPPPPPEQIIRDKAANSLGANFTGPALSGLEEVPGGHRIRYKNCDIYYSPTTGVHEVHGGIRDKYNAKGGPASGVGLPLTDELPASDQTGRFNNFSGNASIYWSPSTGPMVVAGGIRALWFGKTAEQSPYGYPTSDERVLGPNQWYSDFQNSVIYWEGNSDRAVEYARLTPAQLKSAVRKLLKANAFNLPIDSISLLEVSNTGQNFWQSRNRLVTFRIEGYIPINNDFDSDYTLDLRLLFFAQKEANGSTTLRMALNHYSIKTTSYRVHPVDIVGYFNPLAANPDVSAVTHEIYDVFGPDTLPRRIEDLGSVRPKLINLEIPEAVNVLSFKVQPDGGLMVYLKPDFAGALGRLAIQRELDAAAK